MFYKDRLTQDTLQIKFERTLFFMKSLKKISTVLSIALLTFSLTGCSTSSNNSPSASSNSSTSKQSQILYSNLTDDNSQKEVVSLLQAHGVSQLQTDTFLAWTDDFNSRITSPNLPTGFVSMTDDFVDYSSLLFDYKQLPDGNIFPEVNCRFTSFLLMQDHIQMCIRDSVPPGQLLSK